MKANITLYARVSHIAGPWYVLEVWTTPREIDGKLIMANLVNADGSEA